MKAGFAESQRAAERLIAETPSRSTASRCAIPMRCGAAVAPAVLSVGSRRFVRVCSRAQSLAQRRAASSRSSSRGKDVARLAVLAGRFGAIALACQLQQLVGAQAQAAPPRPSRGCTGRRSGRPSSAASAARDRRQVRAAALRASARSGDELRYRRHRRGTRFQRRERALVGARQRSRDNSAGSDDAVGIRQHAERDDARNLLGLREIDGEIFGDLARLKRHDADVRLADLARSGYLQRSGTDRAGDVELAARVDRQLDAAVASVAARADGAFVEQPRIGGQRSQVGRRRRSAARCVRCL